jgi:PAS domain S-box-containing protein
MEPLNYRERRPPADSLASASMRPVIDIDIDDAHALAQGIVDTIRDPLLVLDQDLRVVTANRAFCQTFRMTHQNIEDRAVYALGDGQWNIPALRFLLENIAAPHTVMEGYEVEREFPGIGRRSMLLNAREVVSQRNARRLILLTIEDVTERRIAEREGRSFYDKKKCCCRKCSIALQTAYRSSLASFCSKLEWCNRRRRVRTLGTRISASCQ